MWRAEDRWRAPADGFPPPWASAWGDDRYGLWADLVVGGVVQRLRWIEPTGSRGFLMGSTDAQARRIEDDNLRKWARERECPRHEVRLTRGLWLGDTPCTQELWEAVTGENPSGFKGEQRPVEQVSWDEVQGFLERLGGWLPEGWKAVLPTEAQWEYACRAGTQGAYWWGDEAESERMNTQEAWQGETSEVKRYEANGWGLHDMHGNVWEWCADGVREYREEVETDPEGPVGEAVHRAVRGGSWVYPAARARAAYRLDWHRDWRYVELGCRLALRSSSPGGGAGRTSQAR